MSEAHLPVLKEEILSLFSEEEIELFVDGTLGAGGHASALLEAHPEIKRYIGIDQDEEARAIASERLKGEEARLSIVPGNFRHLGQYAEEVGFDQVGGILLDLGVSSMQLDRAERGFSFMREGPLDMRMDRSQPLTAATICNEWSEEELRRIMRQYGEEPRAGRVAKEIIRKRPFATTQELVAAIDPTLRRKGPSRTHPCTRVFQALRMAVNSELEVVREVLPQAIELLRPGGILAIITFHSLEDRIVKQWFREAASDKVSTSGIGGLFLDKDPLVTDLTRKPIIATEEEIALNPRSRSAKLRAVRKK